MSDPRHRQQIREFASRIASEGDGHFVGPRFGLAEEVVALVVELEAARQALKRQWIASAAREARIAVAEAGRDAATTALREILTMELADPLRDVKDCAREALARIGAE